MEKELDDYLISLLESCIYYSRELQNELLTLNQIENEKNKDFDDLLISNDII